MSLWGGIFNRIGQAFGRKAKWVPVSGNGLEHDDWRVGDLAQCVAKGVWQRVSNGQTAGGPIYGQILRVTHVGMCEGWHFLGFEGVAEFYVAECFLKIRPNQCDACTPAFAQLIRKHSREGVDA